jgi:hypothetical protein
MLSVLRVLRARLEKQGEIGPKPRNTATILCRVVAWAPSGKNKGKQV